MAGRTVELNDIQPQIMGVASGADPGSLHMRGRNLVQQCEGEIEDEDEEEDDGVARQDVPTDQERRWSTYICVVCCFDVLLSGMILIMSWSYAYKDAGVSLWCMGLQAMSHLLSSLMLALRFCGERTAGQGMDELSAASLLRRERRRFLGREQSVAILMGLVMLISTVGLLFKAFRKIKFWKAWYQDHERMDREAQWVIQFLAWYGFSLYFLQAIFRCIAARKFRRQIIWHGFCASVVSLLFLFVMGFAASYEKEWSWKAEPICAIALSFICLAEGVRMLLMHMDDMDDRLRYDPRA